MGKKVVHVEFPAQDLERGKKFWEGVGGWSLNDAGMQGMQYLMFQEGDQGGAVFAMEGVSGTTIYLGSDDIDADLAKVKELGGQAEDKQPIPEHRLVRPLQGQRGERLQPLPGRRERTDAGGHAGSVRNRAALSAARARRCRPA